MSDTCQKILENVYHEALQDLSVFRIKKTALLGKVEYICRCQRNA